MTRTTQRQSIALIMAVLVTAAFPMTSAAVATQSADGPSVRVTAGTTTDGGNTTVDVVLTSAPDGLSGYFLDLTVESPDGASIVDASYPDRFGLTTTPEYRDGGRTVTLEAGDIDGAIEPGATDVRLATVEIAGGDTPSLAVEPRQFDDDTGSQFRPASAAAGSRSTGTETGPATPTSGAGATRATANASATATGGSGPLAPVLVVVAVALVSGVGLRRRSET